MPQLGLGTLGTSTQKMLQEMKAEAAYFTAMSSCERGGFVVFDLQDPSQIPAVAEPFFLAFNARVWFCSVMNAQDIANALPGTERVVKE